MHTGRTHVVDWLVVLGHRHRARNNLIIYLFVLLFFVFVRTTYINIFIQILLFCIKVSSFYSNVFQTLNNVANIGWR